MTDIYWGDSRVKSFAAESGGSLVVRDGEPYYKISNYHTIPPFFMTIVSGSDHWMFVSSTGGLTCGRGNPDHALFPYYTDDKIHDAASTSGPQTILLVKQNNRTSLWKPFGQDVNVYRIERNLFKNQTGNKLVFEEINHDLNLVFSYSWSNSDRFGFIKTSTLSNTGTIGLKVDVLDGLRNILPPGISHQLQAEVSTLVDAYKQAQSFPDRSSALYSMSSALTDRAEPSEALKASVVWSTGLEDAIILLSGEQLESFCSGARLSGETGINGQRGAFYVQSAFDILPGDEKRWMLLADVAQDPCEIAALFNLIDQEVSQQTIQQDVEAGSQRLLQLVGDADGCQLSSDTLTANRHFSNTLFNIMRGGTFYDEYNFPQRDFLNFVGLWNKPLKTKFENLPGFVEQTRDLASVLDIAKNSGDADMERIVLEYLPLTFSRRHGDPSRPWNRFSIDLKNADGTDRLYYQGNWRDIFQNWEALLISYPEFAESIICKFVNASTADGYNPYRITKDGFEWEKLNPEDPWSNIGYWGDHQVNYLLKLIELSCRYHPGKINSYLDHEIFVYADVPYRLKNYQSLLKDPRNSVVYDSARDLAISERVSKQGSDGRLLRLPDGSIYRVNLLEKLLVTSLAKLGNFVPGGGIWMNTQRPEWNDANNALTGYGLSMVTLYYLRRFLVLLEGLLDEFAADNFSLSIEVLSCFEAIEQVFSHYVFLLDTPLTPPNRKAFMDDLGVVGEQYRKSVYPGFSGNKRGLSKTRVLAFIGLAQSYLEHSIELNRRKDGLFNAYNLIRIDSSGYSVEPLGEMLEGQVAVLSSGYLDAKDSLNLLDALRSSRMYRQDQNSYLLYPDKKLPRFLEKAVINPTEVENSEWIQNELKTRRIDFVQKDVNGAVHFNSRFKNADELRIGLENDSDSNPQDRDSLCAIYETVFKHHQFTGRSGAMFKYEGLGCIYWHMVSKLLLATSEVVHSAHRNGVEQALLNALIERFDDIRDGLGLHKSPGLYGGFPVDPYSHTTGFSGVQQPGMTGQVKEDVITRFKELGVDVCDGEISFLPVLLQKKEFISEPRSWQVSLGGPMQMIDLDAGSMAFCLCGVPVIYSLAEHSRIQVVLHQGDTQVINGNDLGFEWSQSIFKRDRRVRKLLVELPVNSIRV